MPVGQAQERFVVDHELDAAGIAAVQRTTAVLDLTRLNWVTDPARPDR